MDDLEPRLEHELGAFGRTPLAEPQPVDDLRRRVRRVRGVRVVSSVLATAIVVVLVAGGVAFARHDGPRPETRIRVAAPGFVLSDVDAVVRASGFDPDGARLPIPPDLVAQVAAVPGVQRVNGVLDTFAPLAGPQPAANHPPRTAILFSYYQPDEIHLTAGTLPSAPDEIVVDSAFVSRYQLGIGDTAALEVRDVATPLRIVGTFELPDLDVSAIPLAATAAAHEPAGVTFDRLDVKLASGADADAVRAAIGRAVGTDYVVEPPSVISIPDQRLAQLEIQHAYWALLSPDPSERSTAVAGPHDPKASQTYREHYQETLQAELRVEDVHFISPDEATLTYRVFFEGSPSPIVNAPQAGAAVRLDGTWKLTSATVCALAQADHLTCPTPGATAPAAATRP